MAGIAPLFNGGSHVDYLAMAEILETQAASLRREHERLTASGQQSLELDAPGDTEWHEWDGGEQPPETYGRNVDVKLRDGYEMSGPAGAITWEHHDAKEGGARDVTLWRL